MHTGHFFLLYGGSERLCKDLSGLHHNGYAQRIGAQIALGAWVRQHREGSLPRVYALDNRGADELALWYRIPRGRIDWAERNQRLAPWHLHI